ncbi:MAG TPA: DUF2203 domain-containing protein [Phycisphaerae bacterium]|nr:DUF2203 domain-containing protein [Phycisphaerae bacterium]HRR84796.1 DUF2203 domain-containing protein [Phycisphaerae bacterium]
MDAFETVSLTDLLAGSSKKYFSLREANRSIILVRRIVADIVRDYQELCELHAACKAYDAAGDIHRAEQGRERYARITDHISELQEELEKIGCEIKDYRLGLVDFPALLDGRQVYLCWQIGEDRVSHWHEATTDDTQRRPISREFV